MSNDVKRAAKEWYKGALILGILSKKESSVEAFKAGAEWQSQQAQGELPPVPYDEHERAVAKELEERDYWHDKATELANRVGEHFGFDVGEHSNLNCPVQTALDAYWPAPAAVPDADHLSRFIRIMSEIALDLDGGNEWDDDPIPEELWQLYREVTAPAPAEPESEG